MNAVIAIMQKDIKLLMRDRTAVFFTFVFPLIFAFFFGSIFSRGGASGLEVAVADADRSPESLAFIEKMVVADELDVLQTTELEARELVRTGEITAFLLLPAGFGKQYSSLMGGGPPEVLVGIDPARRAEAGYLQGTLMRLGIERFETMFSGSTAMLSQLDETIGQVAADDDLDKGWQALLLDSLPKMRDLVETDLDDSAGVANDEDTETIVNPMMPLLVTQTDILRSDDRPRNAFEITIAQGAIWAIMGCVIGFAVTLVQERTLGTFGRLVVAPITRLHILCGKALGCFAAQTGVITLLFTIAWLFLGVEFQLGKLIVAVVASGICFVGVMMLFASLAKTERAAGGMTNGFMLVAGMLGGAMIPAFSMPDWMQAISIFSPVKWSILAMEGAIWRDFSYVELMFPVAILLAIGIVTFGLGARMLKMS